MTVVRALAYSGTSGSPLPPVDGVEVPGLEPIEDVGSSTDIQEGDLFFTLWCITLVGRSHLTHPHSNLYAH